MSIKLINGTTYFDARKGVVCELKEQLSQQTLNFVIVPDNLVKCVRNTILQDMGVDCAFNVKVIGLSSLVGMFVTNKKFISKEQGLIILKKIAKRNKNLLKSFGKIVENDGAVREIFAMIDKLAESLVSPHDLVAAGASIGGILGEKTQDIALLYEKYYTEISSNYFERHILFDAFAVRFKEEKLPQNYHFYLLDFSMIAAEQLRVLEVIATASSSLVIGNICNQNGDNNRIYPRFLTDFCKKMSNLYGVEMQEINMPCTMPEDKNILLENLYGYKQKTDFNGYSSVSEHYAENIYLEVKGVCRQIRKMVVEDSVRYKDITILCPSIDDYASDIKRQFDIFEIPYFILDKKSLSNFAIANLFVTGVQVVNSGYAKDKVLAFSKNILLNINNDDCNKFELYARKYNIDGADFLADFKRATGDPLCDTANEVRGRLIDYISVLEKGLRAKGNDTFDSINSFYNAILQEDGYNGYLTKLIVNGDIKAKINAETAYKKVFEIIDSVRDIVDENSSGQEIYEYIVSIINNTEIGASKQYIDNVLITSDKKAVQYTKNLFVIGANDSVLVTESNGISLFTIAELEILEKLGINFSPTVMQTNYNEKFEGVQLLTKGERIFISYNNQMGEPSLLAKSVLNLLNIKPSPYIADNNKSDAKEHDYAMKIGTKRNATRELRLYLSERMRGIACGDESVFDYLFTKFKEDYVHKYNMKPKNYKFTKANSLAWSKSGEKSFASISAIERYFDCPFKFYCENVLKLKKLQSGGLDIMVTGSFVHRILEKFFKNYKDFGMTDDRLASIAQELCEQTICEREFEVIGLSYSKNILQNSLFKKVKYILQKVVEVARHSDFETIHTELTFGFENSKLPAYELNENGKKYFFRGKIDRIDKFGDYVAIVDYKSSSNVSYGLKEIYYGERVQLLIYLNSYLSNFGVKPFAILYMPLPYSYAKDADKGNSFKYSGLVRNLEGVISHFDNKYDKKGENVLPLSYKIGGDFTDKGLLSEEELKILQNYANKVVAGAISEIESGYIEAKPTSCDRCEYGNICLKKNNVDNRRQKISNRNFTIVNDCEEEGNGKD